MTTRARDYYADEAQRLEEEAARTIALHGDREHARQCRERAKAYRDRMKYEAVGIEQGGQGE